MDDSKSGQVTRFSCEACQAEFPDRDSLAEHRTSCSGERSQPSATRPELPRNAPAEDAGSKSDLLRSWNIESIVAEANATMQWMDEAYESAVAVSKETSWLIEVLDRIKLEKDALHAALGEACGSLRSTIESNKASTGDCLLYQTRMNYATGAMELLSMREGSVRTVLDNALMDQEVAIQKLEDTMRVERSIFEWVARLLSLKPENTEPASSEQADGFGEK